MRVLAVINLYPPHHVGGYEVVCRGVMERFQEAGHEVLVLTSDTRLPGVDDSAVCNHGDVRRALEGWWDWETFSLARRSLRERIAVERHNRDVVEDALQSFQPDVASIWNLGYLSYSIATVIERAGIPIVLALCDDWICYAHRFDMWSTMFERRRWARPIGNVLGLPTTLPTFATAQAVVASEMIGSRVAHQSPWGFRDPPVVRLGVETRDFPVTPPARHRWAWRVLYVGRVLPMKGVPTLVRAMAALPPEAGLDIDGHGPATELDAVRKLASDVGVHDRVHLTRSPRGELRARYRGADVVVFPSEWEEPFGIVPLEAMACGVPVVATGTGGSGEFLRDGVNCLRFTPGDPDALAAALVRLAGDAELRGGIVAGGIDTARHMTMDDYAHRLEQVHARATGRVLAPSRLPRTG